MVGRSKRPKDQPQGVWKNERRKWEPEEDERLRELWGHYELTQVAALLRRSRRGVATRAAKIGLPALSELGSRFCRTTRPCVPTLAEPGTPEKIEVLRHRIENGQELWHPDDPRLVAHFSSDSPFFAEGIRQYCFDDSSPAGIGDDDIREDDDD